MEGKSQIALVALDEAEVDEGDVFSFFDEAWPDAPEAKDVKRDRNVVTFKLGDDEGFLALVPVPIPWADLEGPIATAWYWPEARQALEGHKAHAVVALKGTEDARVARTLMLTRLAAAVTASAKAAGIYWGPVVHSPTDFVKAAKQMDDETLPVHLWVNFQVYRDDTGKGLVTTGLEAFGLSEIEVRGRNSDATKLFETAFNVAHYLLTNGPVVSEGDTIGGSEEERIKVAFGPSVLERPNKVMRLEIGAES